MTDFRITADDRAMFKRCRRQWDLGASSRHDLEPIDPEPANLPAAIKDALAVHYYPGTWDWPRQIVIPLVHKAFLRSVTDRHGDQEAGGLIRAGTAILEQYPGWAAELDDFAPVKIDHDVEGLVPDPLDPDRSLVTPDARRVVYLGRVDLLAVDSSDEYWVVRHQIVPDWQDVESLLLDEAAVAACWAWEQTYLGMEIAGTIHNEVRTAVPAAPAAGAAGTSRPRPRRVAQHGPSGGGRSIPQHRRLYARPAHVAGDRVEQHTAGPVRRTRIRRGREEIASAGRSIGEEARQMTDERLATYPTPAAHCQACRFVPPCLAMSAGIDPAEALAGYHHRPVVAARPRPGQATWSIGRGAAPASFD